MPASPVVHRFQASLFPVNAYLVETEDAVVAVDATMGVTDGSALRASADVLTKPLAAVAVTHSHPDHYGALTSLLGGDDLPIFAVAGVDAAIRRDDAAKEAILRPMFGDEWARVRTFPNRHVTDGQKVELGGATFHVIDLGPGESPHDSVWLLETTDAPPRAFVGDLVYSRMHAYLADGFHQAWLANIERTRRELPADTMFYMGHGVPARAATLLDRQREYIETFLEAVRGGPDDLDELVNAVSRSMHALVPTDDLLFLAQLSVAPIRERLRADARTATTSH